MFKNIVDYSNVPPHILEAQYITLRKIKNNVSEQSDKTWRKRLLRHYCFKKFYDFVIKYMALYLLSKSHYLKNAREYGLMDRYQKLTIFYNVNGFDRYASCNNSAKQWCYNKKTVFSATFGEGYIVYGNRLHEIFLEVIKILIIVPKAFPFC